MVEVVIWPEINMTKSTCPAGPSVSWYQVSIGREINMTLSCFYSSLILFHPQVPMSLGINLTIEYFRNELLRSRHSQRNFHAPELIKVWSSNWSDLFADLLRTHMHPVFIVKRLEQTATFPCTRLYHSGPRATVLQTLRRIAVRWQDWTTTDLLAPLHQVVHTRTFITLAENGQMLRILPSHRREVTPCCWWDFHIQTGLSHPGGTFTTGWDFHIQTGLSHPDGIFTSRRDFHIHIQTGFSHPDRTFTSRWDFHIQTGLSYPDGTFTSRWDFHIHILTGLSHPDRTFTSRQDFHIQTGLSHPDRTFISWWDFHFQMGLSHSHPDGTFTSRQDFHIQTGLSHPDTTFTSRLLTNLPAFQGFLQVLFWLAPSLCFLISSVILACLNNWCIIQWNPSLKTTLAWWLGWSPARALVTHPDRTFTTRASVTWKYEGECVSKSGFNRGMAPH